MAADPELVRAIITARQTEAQQRMFVPFLVTVGLVEAAFFINVASMALFVFATPGK